MRDEGRDVCLRVLGLGPGATAQEIKAAYRDLAKVWHPDRFAHDARLQQKAQEQLKEINDAYARLVSGDFARPNARANTTRATYEQRAPRDANAPPREAAPKTEREGRQATHASADVRVATRADRRVNRIALAAPALAFCATFAFFTPRLLSTGRAPEQAGDAATAVSAAAREEYADAEGRPASAESQTAETKDARAQQKNQAAARQHSTDAAASPATSAAAPTVRAMPTVTVAIDPTTGLRARGGCPNKTSMTFPAGDEPSAYCDAAHNAAPPPRPAADDARAKESNDSRLKSFGNRLASPAKKLFGGGRSSDKKPAGDKDAPRD